MTPGDSLQQAGIHVGYFEPPLRDQVEAVTFKEGDIDKGYGSHG